MKRLIGLGLLACTAASAAAHPVRHRGHSVAEKSARHRNHSIVEKAAHLRPGQFVWEPNAASAGPLFLVIDLSAQRALLYRSGVPVAASTVSTGGKRRQTPTGVFTILEKERVHRSRTYDDAPMPYMERLTWKGVAMHAGHNPGYPASHGCIRLPWGIAKLLYGVTRLGTPVMIRA